MQRFWATIAGALEPLRPHSQSIFWCDAWEFSNLHWKSSGWIPEESEDGDERERESRLVSLAQCESCCHKGPRIIQSAGESAWLWLFFSSKELENPHLFWSCYSCPREQWFYCQTCFELFKTKKLLNQRIGPNNFSCKQHGYLHWLAQSWLVITTGGRTWSSAQSPEKRRTFHFLLGRASFGCPLFFIFIFTFFYFYFWEISKKKNFFFKIQLRILQSNGRIGSWVA